MDRYRYNTKGGGKDGKGEPPPQYLTLAFNKVKRRKWLLECQGGLAGSKWLVVVVIVLHCPALTQVIYVFQPHLHWGSPARAHVHMHHTHSRRTCLQATDMKTLERRRHVVEGAPVYGGSTGGSSAACRTQSSRSSLDLPHEPLD